MSLQVKPHWAESFINWMYRQSKLLYVRGERGADWKKAHDLRRKLFKELVPFMDELRAEAIEEGRRLGKAPEQSNTPLRQVCDKCKRDL